MNRNELIKKMVIKEIENSWWASLIFFDWWQQLVINYFTWKVKRKITYSEELINKINSLDNKIMLGDKPIEVKAKLYYGNEKK